jgi:hypothetical protein
MKLQGIGLSLLLVSACLFSASCKKEKVDPENLKIPRLMIETRSMSYGRPGGEVIQLPVSGTRISLQREPLVNEFDIVNVELVEVDLGLALLIQTSSAGARALYRGTVSNMGGRIVTTVNGNPIGARRIDGAIQDGNFYTFVEVGDESLGALVLELKESLAELRAP